MQRAAPDGQQPSAQRAPKATADKPLTSHVEVPFIRPVRERIFVPAGVVAHADGELSILDARTGVIKRFPPERKCVGAFQGAAPDTSWEGQCNDSLAADPGGHLLVGNHLDGVIVRFGSNGRKLDELRVTGKHESSYPVMKVATDEDGNIYVGDSRDPGGGPVVKKFSPKGGLMWQRLLGRGECSRGEREICALAVDPSGSLCVWTEGLDIDSSRDWYGLLIFDRAGNLRIKRSRDPDYEGFCGDMGAAAFDAKANRYELRFDAGAGYGTDLVKFNPKGKELWRHNWGAAEGTGLAVRPDGKACVTLSLPPPASRWMQTVARCE